MENPQSAEGPENKRESHSSAERGTEHGGAGRSSAQSVVGTNDPAIVTGPEAPKTWIGEPDTIMSIETSRIRGPSGPFNPNIVVVPIDSNGTRHGNGSARQQETKETKGSKANQQDEHDEAKNAGTKPHSSGWWSQKPSLMRVVLISAVTALVFGVAGAWGYSYFFGPDQSSGEKSSGKSSSKGGSGKGGSAQGEKSGEGAKASSTESGSTPDSATSKNSVPGTSPGSSKSDVNLNKLIQAESAWMIAVKELQEAKSAEKESRRREEDARSVLNFFRDTLFSAGRPGNVSLAQAFWAGGAGKDVTLKQAVDASRARVAESFAESPIAEASVREVLGTAYLAVGDEAQAAKEFERAFELRLAMQGARDPATASCRNQLAVAYRLAGRPSDGNRLFDEASRSPARAQSLELSAALLMDRKKFAEAELKLRECLDIRQRNDPEGWKTYEAKSMLGEALLDQRKFPESEPLVLTGYEGMKSLSDKMPSQDKPRLMKSLERVIMLYDAWGKTDTAKNWRKKLQAAKAEQSALSS
jgi:tetratricopeptide (TPR) repeat protein